MHYDWGLRAVKSLLRQVWRASANGQTDMKSWRWMMNLDYTCSLHLFCLLSSLAAWILETLLMSLLQLNRLNSCNLQISSNCQAGSLKNKERHTDENIVLCRALRDFNLPKITTQVEGKKGTWESKVSNLANETLRPGCYGFIAESWMSFPLNHFLWIAVWYTMMTAD